MEIREVKEITEKKEVVTGFKCDVCGRKFIGSKIPNDWHKFEGHHHGWGNNSIDSYDYFLACSPKCYFELLDKALIDFEEYKDDEAQVDGFKIEFLQKLLKEKQSKI